MIFRTPVGRAEQIGQFRPRKEKLARLDMERPLGSGSRLARRLRRIGGVSPVWDRFKDLWFATAKDEAEKEQQGQGSNHNGIHLIKQGFSVKADALNASRGWTTIELIHHASGRGWEFEPSVGDAYRGCSRGGVPCAVGNMLRIASIRHPPELRFITKVDHIFRAPIS